MARPRIRVFGKLSLDREAVPRVALRVSLYDGFGKPLPGDGLLHRVDRDDVRHAAVVVGRARGVVQIARDSALGVPSKVKIEVLRCTDLQMAEVDPRFPPTLHRHHHDDASRPLSARLGAPCATKACADAASREISLL